MINNWQPMDSKLARHAKRTGTPLLVWHDHESDPYYEPEPSTRLTIYGSHAEGLSILRKPGVYRAVWGGEYHEDVSGEGWGPFVDIPDWWFLDDDNWETPLAPVACMPCPGEPKPCS